MAKRKKYDSAFMAEVAIEAIKEKETMKALADKYDVSPYLISRWKRVLIANSNIVFDKGAEIDRELKRAKKMSAEMEKLGAEIRTKYAYLEAITKKKN